MSFRNKMKNRGISKLDKLVETPDYITPPTPKKASWNWLKIAIPVTAGLALIIIPVSILGATGAFSAKNAANNKGGGSGDSSSYDPDFNWDPGSGGSGSSDAAPESDESYNRDLSFENLLANHHVEGNISIEVCDYADGYMEPTYIFVGDDSVNIINSLKGINSDISAYYAKSNASTVNLNSSKYFMGISHQLRFNDGTHSFMGMYYSQFTTFVVEDSAYDLTGSEAYTLMDAHIEMDYNPTFDETIN